MKDYMQIYHARRVIESKYEWRKWADQIPYLELPNTYKIKVIPPFGGAIARFIVSNGKKSASVYLDCYDELGYFGEPYWEIYPCVNGDTYRCAMDETEELIEEIVKSVEGV